MRSSVSIVLFFLLSGFFLAALVGAVERSRKLVGVAGACLVVIVCIIVFVRPVQLPSLREVLYGHADTTTTLGGPASRGPGAVLSAGAAGTTSTATSTTTSTTGTTTNTTTSGATPAPTAATPAPTAATTSSTTSATIFAPGAARAPDPTEVALVR